MILIIGLGNPGKKYEFSRHNLGFFVLDRFSKKNLFEFKSSKKFKSRISKGYFGKKGVILIKPQTFMNNSGKAVKSLAANYKRQTTNIWVIHDDIDLPLGKIKIVKNRGAAGHKGVESIIKAVNSKIFVRFRIGIQPKTDKPKNPEKFVLQKFNKEEGEIVKEVIKKTVEAIEFFLKYGLEKAMSKFNE